MRPGVGAWVSGALCQEFRSRSRALGLLSRAGGGACWQRPLWNLPSASLLGLGLTTQPHRGAGPASLPSPEQHLCALTTGSRARHSPLTPRHACSHRLPQMPQSGGRCRREMHLLSPLLLGNLMPCPAPQEGDRALSSASPGDQGLRPRCREGPALGEGPPGLLVGSGGDRQASLLGLVPASLQSPPPSPRRAFSLGLCVSVHTDLLW